MEVYQHFKDPLEARKIFANLIGEKVNRDQFDEEDQALDFLTVEALERWADAEYPGTWDEWWIRWYSDHLEDREEYLSWKKSKSS